MDIKVESLGSSSFLNWNLDGSSGLICTIIYIYDLFFELSVVIYIGNLWYYERDESWEENPRMKSQGKRIEIKKRRDFADQNEE